MKNCLSAGVSRLFLCAVTSCLVAGCNESSSAPDPAVASLPAGVDLSAQENHAATPTFTLTGTVSDARLNEISGVVVGWQEHLVVHNDDGEARLYIIDDKGSVQGSIEIDKARNRDWEDLALVPDPAGDLLVIGDIGDNLNAHKSIQLYLVDLPVPNAAGVYPGSLETRHKIKLKYPDGAQDCEALAYDAASETLLFLTKRKRPPRIYGISKTELLSSSEATLQFLGDGPSLRPPTAEDLIRDISRGAWVSQPTGMDISRDGKRAAVISYRSLYVFERSDNNPMESWVDVMARPPLEFIGPAGSHEEAVTFSAGSEQITVLTERLPAPIYRLKLSAQP